MVQAAQQSIDAVEALRQSIVELNHSFRRIAEENQALPYRLAIDVGANRGDVSERLLQAGFEVYAFEPFPPVLERLQERLANNPNFHSLAEGLVFKQSVPVAVKTLAGLYDTGEVPSQVGLVKIDAEGFDLVVIKGMGDFRYSVVVAEFWDPGFPFAQTGAMNDLKDMVPAMRQREYAWHVIIYRIWGGTIFAATAIPITHSIDHGEMSSFSGTMLFLVRP